MTKLLDETTEVLQEDGAKEKPPNFISSLSFQPPTSSGQPSSSSPPASTPLASPSISAAPSRTSGRVSVGTNIGSTRSSTGSSVGSGAGAHGDSTPDWARDIFGGEMQREVKRQASQLGFDDDFIAAKPASFDLVSQEEQDILSSRSAKLPPLQSIMDLTTAHLPPTVAQQDSETELKGASAAGKAMADGAGVLADGTTRARNSTGQEWEEQWGEEYGKTGWANKWADKWAKNDINVWHEKWGENYDGQGGCRKYTDKWAERKLTDGALEQWGDKWEETFGDGKGTKHGEVWSDGSQGRYQRWWNEEHYGNKDVRMWGDSTGGENWDYVQQMDAKYNPIPHFGFDLALSHSPNLLSVKVKVKSLVDGDGNEDEDPFGGGIDAL
eukprot:gene22770-29937_t